MHKVVFLIGARASGKTSTGKRLANTLGVPFVDTDERLCADAGMTVAEIVEREGWDGFRRRESATLRTAAAGAGVVATGGGMPLAAENRAFMRERGTVLYLHANADVLARRLKADPLAAQRPSLTGKNIVGEMTNVLAQREPLYMETAHAVLDASLEPEMVIAAALAAISKTEEDTPMQCSWRDIAAMIDLSLLNPTMTTPIFEEGIKTALEYEVASVCIIPSRLKFCSERLKGSRVNPSTVIGFPHGTCLTETKVDESKFALRDGGVELDMVVNISAVLSGDWDFVKRDIAAVLAPVHDAGAKVKVIFENCYLQDEQKIRLCEICGELGADWVKTSTGYGTGGAVDADLVLMRKHSPASVQVKAAGGVRDLDRALRMRELGCTRFGCTRTREILEDAKARFGR